MAKILVLNGPNLNLLGTREPEVYGHENLTTVNKHLTEQSQKAEHELICKQSNSEGTLIDLIQAANQQNIKFIIFNPAALTHSSIALRDALLAVDIPFIEIHLSNVYQREEFRQFSYFSDIAEGVIVGLGTFGYELALQAAIKHLN